MAIKEELVEEVKEEGGGQAELEALDALEAEAKEFNKVYPISFILHATANWSANTQIRTQKSTAFSKPSDSMPTLCSI